MFYIHLMIGCYQKDLGPKGNVVQDGSEGYWKLTVYKVKGKSTELTAIPDKFYLHTQQQVMQSDSLEQPVYSKGMPYIIFTFFNEQLTRASFIQAVEYDNSYNKKSEQSRFWYKINQDSGFLTILNMKPDNRNTTRIELSNVIASPTYKPELDSLRYI
jgi:hypothetical protein